MQQQQTEMIRLFWQPGCSACVKIKEMLTDNGVPFESINILENQAGLEEMQRRGIKALPLVFRGEAMVFGQSLDDVAKFIGVKRDMGRLPSEVLKQKWSYILDKALIIIEKMPDERLLERAFPERPRVLGELSYHVFQIPEAFLAVMDKGLEDTRPIVNGIYPHLKTKADILNYARGIRAELDAWFAANPALGEGRTVKTYWGVQQATQLLERFTWHSAQHTRQLDFVLSTETGAPSLIDPTVYEGLPIPHGMWD
jgi:glutaredoxin